MAEQLPPTSEANAEFAPSALRWIAAILTTGLGVAFFFSIIGVFGLSVAIGSLALYVAVVLVTVLRSNP